MHQRTQRLLTLMEQHELKISDVARIVQRSDQTVRIWRSKNGARIIPEQALRLLELAIQLRTGQPTLDLDGGAA